MSSDIFKATCERDLQFHKNLFSSNVEIAEKIAENIWEERFRCEPPAIDVLSCGDTKMSSSKGLMNWLDSSKDGTVTQHDVMNLYAFLTASIQTENVIDRHINHFIRGILLKLALGAADDACDKKNGPIDWEVVNNYRADLKLFLEYREKERELLQIVNSNLHYVFENDDVQELIQKGIALQEEENKGNNN